MSSFLLGAHPLSSPFVSIVIPTHNRPQMLAEALASVQEQTFLDYEIIVVSNGESDAVQRESRAVATNRGARYFALREGNPPAARNFGIEQAKGKWVAFLDDDDLWFPNKLERQVAEGERTGADLIAADSVRFFPNGREIVEGLVKLPPDWDYHKAFCHHRWCPGPSGVIVRRQALNAVGGFDPDHRYGEDVELWRRIAWQHKIHLMNDVLTRYRCGHGATWSQSKEVQKYELRHYLKMRHDTPEHLRDAIPTVTAFLQRWFLRRFTPRWMRHPRKQFMKRWTLLRARATF